MTKEINLIDLLQQFTFHSELDSLEETDATLINFIDELELVLSDMSSENYLESQKILPSLSTVLNTIPENTLEEVDLLLAKKKILLGERIIQLQEEIQNQEENIILPTKAVESERKQFIPIASQEENPLVNIAASQQAWVVSLDPIIEKDPRQEINQEQASPSNHKKVLMTDSSPCNYLLASQNLVAINDISFKIEEAKVESQKELSKVITNQIKDKMTFEQLGETIKVSLYPEFLGKVTIECQRKDKLKIEIFTEKLSTLALLQSYSSDLKENLVQKLQETLETNLNFSLDKNGSEEQTRKNFHYYDLMPLTDEKVELYLIHNGLINFLT